MNRKINVILISVFLVVLLIGLLCGCSGEEKIHLESSSPVKSSEKDPSGSIVSSNANSENSESDSQPVSPDSSKGEISSASTETSSGVLTSESSSNTDVSPASPPSFGSSSSVSSFDDTVWVSEIVISEEIHVKVGEKLKIDCSVLPEDASDKTVTMILQGNGVFSLEDGVLYAHEQGTEELTVTSNDGKATRMVKLFAEDVVHVTGVELISNSFKLEMGKDITLGATVLPVNAEEKAVTWKSSNTAVLAVDQTGKLTARSLGTAVITVTTRDGGFTDRCTVEVEHTVHVYGEWIVFAEPTCENVGMRYRECEICKSGSYEYEAIPATGHRYGEMTVKTAASKEKNGSGTHTCTVCSQSETVVLRYTDGEIAHGDLGRKIDFSLYNDGTVYVRGSGVMYDWSASENPMKSLKGVKKIILSDGITAIADSTFRSQAELSEVVLPESMTLIGARAFYECVKLEKINIPDSVRLIQDSAFYSCIALKEINIPKNVVGLGNNTFDNCKSLLSVTLPAKLETVGARCFYNCRSLKEVRVLSSLKEIPIEMFAKCSSLTHFTIPETVTTVSTGAFSECTSLTEIVIPSKATLETDVFSGCTALRSADLGNCTLNAIADNLFKNCTSLEKIILPGSLKIIGINAFFGCANIAEIVYPGGCEALLTDVVIADGNTEFKNAVMAGISAP